MPVKAVCNASPLIFLAKINCLRLLDDYSLQIPNQVKDEVLAGHKKGKADAHLILDYLETRRVEPVKVVPLRDSVNTKIPFLSRPIFNANPSPPCPSP